MAGIEVNFDENRVNANAYAMVEYMNKAGINTTIDDIPLSVSESSYDAQERNPHNVNPTRTQDRNKYTI